MFWEKGRLGEECGILGRESCEEKEAGKGEGKGGGWLDFFEVEKKTTGKEDEKP